MAGADLVTSLRQAGVSRGDLVALVISPAAALGLAAADSAWPVPGVMAEVGRADEELRPRWVVWSGQTAGRLAAAGVRLATCWDIAAAHRLLFGGWRADPGLAWARLRGLATDTMPADGPLDLFGMDEGDASDPVAPDGHLRPEWVSGGWSDSPERIARWAALARTVAGQQQAALAALDGRPMALATARCESTAELLCAELSADGLPMDRAVAEQVLTSFIGPRPRSEAEALALRAARDAEVLRHAPAGVDRRPAQPGPGASRCWPGWAWTYPTPGPGDCGRCEDAHPLVGALLRLAEGGADRDHLRLRLAGRVPGPPTAGCAARGPARMARRAG